MSAVSANSTDTAGLYNEFTNALTEVLAENAAPWPAGTSARCSERHPDYSEHAYFMAVEAAFTRWESLQNAVARATLVQSTLLLHVSLRYPVRLTNNGPRCRERCLAHELNARGCRPR
jgi:hypothetical protein